MSLKAFQDFLQRGLIAILFTSLSSCSSGVPIPIQSINNSLLRSASSHRAPSLGTQWLGTLAIRNGRERIEMINLLNGRQIPLPGLNRPDAQPISVSVNANGERIAVIRQRGERTELLLYRRNVEAIQVLDIKPQGIPRHVSLNGTGRVLAVQVSREGRWDVDVIQLAR